MASCSAGRLAVIVLAAAAAGLTAQEPGRAVTPVADHHIHLRSPAVTQLFGEQIPVVELPADLQRLLLDFETHWRARSAASLARLFTDDGVMQVGRDWRPGPDAIHIALLGRGGNIRLHAQAFGVGESNGYIAGSYRADADSPPGELGRFLFAVARAGGGSWRLAAATLNNLAPEVRTPATTVDELVAQLDAAGIRRGAVLSWAYQFGAPGRVVSDERGEVRAENDWTAEQAARFPDRLVALCSFNPLKDYALDELARCIEHPGLVGVKLHFTTSAVDLRSPAHVERLRTVVQTANASRFPIVIHMRTLDPGYGRRDAEVFVNEILAAAPDSPVQIAHLAGWGGYGPETDAALEVFAEGLASGDARLRHVYFDLSGVVFPGMPDETRTLIARRIRQLGVDRMLFAIDGAVSAEPWERLRTLLPLEAEELAAIARNLAPYMRGGR